MATAGCVSFPFPRMCETGFSKKVSFGILFRKNPSTFFTRTDAKGRMMFANSTKMNNAPQGTEICNMCDQMQLPTYIGIHQCKACSYYICYQHMLDIQDVGTVCKWKGCIQRCIIRELDESKGRIGRLQEILKRDDVTGTDH